MPTQQLKPTESKAGRKETLTRDMAKKIAKLIEKFPDAKIEVTWKNVIEQTKRAYGVSFHRNTLSQKEWDGEKIIANAFDEAEEIQKRMARDDAPKYAEASRTKLRELIGKLQAENLALREQIVRIRLQQFDEARSLLDLRTPLHRLVEPVGEPPTGNDGGGAAPAASHVVSIGKPSKPPKK